MRSGHAIWRLEGGLAFHPARRLRAGALGFACGKVGRQAFRRLVSSRPPPAPARLAGLFRLPDAKVEHQYFAKQRRFNPDFDLVVDSPDVYHLLGLKIGASFPSPEHLFLTFPKFHNSNLRQDRRPVVIPFGDPSPNRTFRTRQPVRENPPFAR